MFCGCFLSRCPFVDHGGDAVRGIQPKLAEGLPRAPGPRTRQSRGRGGPRSKTRRSPTFAAYQAAITSQKVAHSRALEFLALLEAHVTTPAVQECILTSSTSVCLEYVVFLFIGSLFINMFIFHLIFVYYLCPLLFFFLYRGA